MESLSSVICVLILAIGITNAEDCSTKNMKCMQMMPTEQPKGDALAPYCKKAREFVKCGNDLKGECPGEDYSVVDGMEKNLGMICSSAGEGGAPAGTGCGGPDILKCLQSAGLGTDMPQDDDVKSNKDGICTKIQAASTCIATLEGQCGDKIPTEMQTTITAVNGKKDMCPKTETGNSSEEKPTGSKAEPKEDGEKEEGPTDSATRSVISSLLLLTLPVFLQFWM